MGIFEFFADLVGHVLVEGFALDDVEVDVHELVDFIESLVGDLVDFLPDFGVGGVAILEFFEFCAGDILIFDIGFEEGVAFSV